MQNNRNFLIAMILSIGVLVGWQFLVVSPRMEAQRLENEAAQSNVAQNDGSLQTPWGVGQWGAHPDAEDHVFADFVGAKHNVKLLPSGLGVSTRCADKNTVLLRSIKAAKLAAK